MKLWKHSEGSKGLNDAEDAKDTEDTEDTNEPKIQRKQRNSKKFPFLLFAFALALFLLSGCRTTQKAFKGMELYSWQDEIGVWQFSILPGTNRNKTVSEVKESPLTTREVKAKFCRMAKGEQVFWMPQAQDSATGEAHTFPLPPGKIIAGIEALAADCEVEITNPLR